jgi:hypothetical protein
MKNRKRFLPLCLLAAALPASAMYLNPQGTGQVLLFPYFTVQNQQNTLLSVTNTSASAKVFQVTFREGYAGRELLQFQVFLAPQDSWTGTVFLREPQGPMANIATADSSCTAPDKTAWTGQLANGIYYQSFFDRGYTSPYADTGPTGPARSHEGFVEVIERAELSGALATAAASRNCAALQSLRSSNTDLQRPRGGLRGHFAVIDLPQGTLFGGNATAIDDFSRRKLYSDVDLPEWLTQGNNRDDVPDIADAVVPAAPGLATLSFSGPRRANAVSALLMADSLYGDLLQESAVGGDTEWVITQPTKFLHVARQPAAGTVQLAPYEVPFGGQEPGTSCSPVQPRLWDREGVQKPLEPDAIGVPPPDFHKRNRLCYSVDVAYLSPAGPLARTPLLDSQLGSWFLLGSAPFQTGTLTLELGSRADGTRSYLPPGSAGTGLQGLPAIGFQAVRYINGNVLPGVLANYTLAIPLNCSAPACTDAVGAVVDCP